MRLFLLMSALVLSGNTLGACTSIPSSTFSAAGYPVAAGSRFRDSAQAPELVVIPAGSFVMGSSPAETTREGRHADTAAYERPQHRVSFDRPLAVSRYLVTRAEYASFVTATNHATQGCMVLDGKWQSEPQRSFADPGFAQAGNEPAVCVNAADAEAYVDWLSTLTGHGYRLLHETEWEYAARADTQTARWWGDTREQFCAHANGADRHYARAYPGEQNVNTACDDGFANTNPGDAFPANAFGLHDMIGNVWEWTADCFSADSSAAIAATSDCKRRSIRGASWHNHFDALRAAARFWLPAQLRSSSVGFRVARVAD